jgi:hypothetical protein
MEGLTPAGGVSEKPSSRILGIAPVLWVYATGVKRSSHILARNTWLGFRCKEFSGILGNLYM